MSPLIRLPLLLVIALTGFAAPVLAQGFTPHRAVYDLDVMDKPKATTFSQVDGRMVYEFDMTCERLLYSHRMLMNLVTQQGQSIRSEAVVSFLESRDGRDMRFSVRESYNGLVTSHREGTVKRGAIDAPATVTYSRNEGEEKDTAPDSLPRGTLFPLGHSIDMVRAAVAGEIFHNARTFDGDDVSFVDTFISKDKGAREESLPEVMQETPAWIMRVAFYRPEAIDSAPYYESQMRMFANGVSGSFTMETDNLSAIARLTELELRERPVCD